MKHTAWILTALIVATALPATAGFGRVGEETYRCTVDVGGGLTPDGLPNAGVDTHTTPLGPDAPHTALGGCQLRGELVDSGTVTDVTAPDGCAAFADDARIASGDAVSSGQSLWAYCEAGVTDAEIEVTVDFGG